MSARYIRCTIREQIDRAKMLKAEIPASQQHAALGRLAVICRGTLEKQLQLLERADGLLDGGGTGGGGAGRCVRRRLPVLCPAGGDCLQRSAMAAEAARGPEGGLARRASAAGRKGARKGPAGSYPSVPRPAGAVRCRCRRRRAAARPCLARPAWRGLCAQGMRPCAGRAGRGAMRPRRPRRPMRFPSWIEACRPPLQCSCRRGRAVRPL